MKNRSGKPKKIMRVVEQDLLKFRKLMDIVSSARKDQASREFPSSQLWQIFEKIVKGLLVDLELSTVKLENLPLTGPEWVEFEFYVDSQGFYGEHDKLRCNIREGEGSLKIDLEPLYKGAGEYALEKLGTTNAKLIMGVIVSNLWKTVKLAGERERWKDQELGKMLEILSAVAAKI